MKDRLILLVVLAIAVAGCATTATIPGAQALATRGLHQPTDDEDMRCKVTGLFFGDLAALRDGGHDKPAAIAQASERLRELAVSGDEKRHADHAVASASSSAGLVYAFKDIKPEAMMEYGASLCLMVVVGDHDPDNALRLANETYSCQEVFADRVDLRQCVVDHALGFVVR